MINLRLSPGFDSSLKDDIKNMLPKWTGEFSQLLPTNPDALYVEISELTSHHEPYREGDWSFAVSGSALNSSTIALKVATSADLTRQDLIKSIKATYSHEYFHIARGYSFESKGLSLTDVAIEEGAATKFEVMIAKSRPWYGEYSDRVAMLNTLAEVRKADKQGDIDWSRWKFYDSETGRHWILYRLGTFIIDEVLANNSDIKIQDIAKLTTSEIITLTGL